MTLTELTARLLLLFFPGIVCYYVVDVLTVHRERRVHEVFLLSFVYGILSYGLFAVVNSAFSIHLNGQGLLIPYPRIGFFKTLSDGQAALDFGEIFMVAALAVLVGIAISTAANHFWLHDLARFLKITRRFPQTNVWSYAFDAKEVQWATIRDMKYNLMYQGYIRAFSDVEETRELLLQDVYVYNEKTGERLYESDHLYLARNKDDLTVEFPIVQTEEESA